MNITELISKAKMIRPSPTEDFYTLTTSQMEQFVSLVANELAKQSKASTNLERDD